MHVMQGASIKGGTDMKTEMLQHDRVGDRSLYATDEEHASCFGHYMSLLGLVAYQHVPPVPSRLGEARKLPVFRKGAESGSSEEDALNMRIRRERKRKLKEEKDLRKRAKAALKSALEADGEVLEEEVESDHDDVCTICLTGGDLLCCDKCPRVYHLECLVPKLSAVPNDTWFCPICRPPEISTYEGGLHKGSRDVDYEGSIRECMTRFQRVSKGRERQAAMLEQDIKRLEGANADLNDKRNELEIRILETDNNLIRERHQWNTYKEILSVTAFLTDCIEERSTAPSPD